MGVSTPLAPPGSLNVLYIVDLSSYVLRAYHAISELRAPSGEPTHAVHGTVSMLERLIREHRPQLMAIALDAGRDTFRKDLYADYKANRPPAPSDLKVQLERCEQVVRAYGFAVYQQKGVEADDLIATLVRHARAAGLKVVVVGADKDLMQLVGDDVVLYDTMRDRVFGPEEVRARFGVEIHQVRDLLALMGDTSDNIPGVPSVGPKTARDLLVEHGTLDGIFRHLDGVKRKKLKETLAEHEEQARLSQRLVTLKDDCDIDFDPSSMGVTGRDTEALRAIYRELGFTRQLANLEADEEVVVQGVRATMDPKETTIEVLTDSASLRRLIAPLGEGSTIGLEAFGTSPAVSRGDLVGLALSTESGKGVYVPLAHRYLGAPHQLPVSELVGELAPLLAAGSITKHVADLKKTLLLLRRAGFDELDGVAMDCQLAAYLLDPEANHALEATAKRELDADLTPFEVISKKGRGRRLDLDEMDVDEVAAFAARRVDATRRLAPILDERLDDAGVKKLYVDVELPLVRVLAHMEEVGVLVDTACLSELGERLEKEIARLEARAHEVAGRVFNVNSPRQLEALLFDELGLKPIKRTKTSRSTDAATLEALSGEHELPGVILEVRQLSKLKGTYIDALPKLVDPQTGRVHGTWGQTTAATGRLSSTDPNLQNIPIRTSVGREIRAAFVAPPGQLLVSGDYSQIELRVLAHLSKDPVLLDAFRTGQDIHTRTAMEIFEVAQEDVTREQRTRAKAVNFGVIYGQGESGLAKATGISRKEAGDFIARYFRRYKGVQRFMNETLDRARAAEAVTSILGRRRMLADIKSGNRARRLAAERVAMNMPIQGSAADIMKLAMLALKEPVTPSARMILTVHDELVFEVAEAEVEEAKQLIKTKMEHAYRLDVPLEVEVGFGGDWRSAH